MSQSGAAELGEAFRFPRVLSIHPGFDPGELGRPRWQVSESATLAKGILMLKHRPGQKIGGPARCLRR